MPLTARPLAALRASKVSAGSLYICPARAAFIAALLFAPAAHAGGRPYAFASTVDALPETGLEIESWFGFERHRDAAEGTSVDWWIGPVAGATDYLETALYAVFVQEGEGGKSGSRIGLGALRFQLSYLPVPVGTWPIDLRFRIEYEQPIGDGYQERDRPSTWLDVIASFDAAGFNLTLNFGGLLEYARSGVEAQINYALGASYEVVQGLRLGLEENGYFEAKEKELENFVGPSLAYGFGRLWSAATFGFGLGHDSPSYLGRIVLGLTF